MRIGANWGSLDQELLTSLMDENAASPAPLEAGAVTREAMVRSALLSAARAEEIGLPRERIILSAKVSSVQDLITVYRMLGERSDYALHLGLTEAGMGSKGIVASAAALGALLQEGLGDTIRISLTPEPGGDRTQEVRVAQELLQSMGFRSFAPQVAACPGCGRTTSTVFQELARDIQGYLVQSSTATIAPSRPRPSEPSSDSSGALRRSGPAFSSSTSADGQRRAGPPRSPRRHAAGAPPEKVPGGIDNREPGPAVAQEELLLGIQHVSSAGIVTGSRSIMSATVMLWMRSLSEP